MTMSSLAGMNHHRQARHGGGGDLTIHTLKKPNAFVGTSIRSLALIPSLLSSSYPPKIIQYSSAHSSYLPQIPIFFSCDLHFTALFIDCS
ncbi:hypothetical protein QVD17_13599 [Tagetes erecta]|uniref:Uncharacterized protein n=1 Tax=Tagetes erecta TaxID=13708 RepID=A0AAD8L0R7_TARER|nr:hypothetical protein QVD17_13599 [Tagetes erecta]